MDSAFNALLLTFAHGIGLLAVVAIGYGVILKRLDRHPLLRQWTIGGLFGLAATVSMLDPAVIAPGIITDARAIMAGLAAAFGGPLAVIPAVVLPGAYRWWLGGVGATAGVAGVVLAGLGGLIASRFVTARDGALGVRQLALLGAVAGAMLMLSALLLPSWDLTVTVLERAGPALFAAAVAGSVVLGTMLSRDGRRLAAERTIRASESRLRFLADHALDAIARIDLDGRLVYTTDAVRDILGYSPAEVAGVTLESLVHPDDRDGLRTRMAALGPTTPTMLIRCRLGRKDGAWIWTEAAIRLTDGGQAAEYVGVLRDITRRKEVEDKLEAARRSAETSRAFVEALFEQAQTALAVIDDAGRLLRVNTAFCHLTGWTAEELAGHAAVEVLPVAGAGETELRRRDGGSRTVLIAESAVFDSEGQRFRLAALMDITAVTQLTAELRAAKEEEAVARAAAENANQSKGDFLASLSHELRTPLNAVIGFADLIAREAEGPVGMAVYRDFAVNIRDSGQHLLELINEILDHARAEAGMLTLAEDTVDLDAAVEFAVRMLKPRADRAGVCLSVIKAVDVRFLRGDERRLRQILLNLISNAVKYTPSGGEVTVRLSLAGDGPRAGALELDVTDTGIGIPEGEVERVLQAFARVESGSNRRTEGTGLGLPLTKRLVELHGGTLSLRSSLGTGTTVTVTLPARRVLRPAQCAAAPVTPIMRPLAILLVDDDPLLRMSTTALLETWGHRVLEAANGNEALSILRGGEPVDLLFTDMVMPPGMNGTELALQAERLRPGIAVLLTSGFAGHAVVGEAGTGRNYDMISKPFMALELKERLERVVGRIKPSAPRTPLPHPVPRPVPDTVRGDEPVWADDMSSSATAPPAPFHVLLAEDQPLNQRLAMLMLNGLGCTVDVVGDGAAAVDAVRHHAYDLVLMDVNMPVMDGLEAVRLIRTLPAPAGTLPIHAMTAGGLDEDRAACRKAGMDGHVSKPLNHDELAALVRHLEAHRSLELTLA